MSKKTRKIIHIDQERCNGCGQCLPGCPEGALQVVDGKARLVKESYCDGLGACLGHCPAEALKVEERDADEYDACGVLSHLEAQSPELAERHREHMRAHGLDAPGCEISGPAAGCPSEHVLSRGGSGPEQGAQKRERPEEFFSSLNNWPVKLHLIPPNADFLKNADLLLVADCVPFACGTLHTDFIKGRAVAAGCPKFDDREAYVEKIAQILESVNLRSITIVHMEITCCCGFVRIVREALERAGKVIPLEMVKIGVHGEVIIRECEHD